MNTRARNILIGMGSLLSIIPASRSEQEPIQIGRYSLHHGSEEEAWASDRAALQGDVDRVGRDFWKALDSNSHASE